VRGGCTPDQCGYNCQRAALEAAETGEFHGEILLDDAKLTHQTSTDCTQRSEHSGDAGQQNIALKKLLVGKKLLDHNLQGAGSKRILFETHPDQNATIHWIRNGNNQITSNLVITQRFR
jgi:hypothetical protein